MSVRNELQGIYDEHGTLTAEMVVEAARPDESPLHNQFEWDNSAAAERYRIIQGAKLIRKVQVVYAQDAKGRGKAARYWINYPSGDGLTRSYHPPEAIAHDDLAQQIVLRDIKRDWQAMKRKYGHLQEFWQIVRGEEDAA